MLRKIKWKRLLLFLILAGVMTLASCATQSNEPPAVLPGFLKGLLHGFIILFSFISSFFTDWRIYAYPNNGGWYNFGFLIGVSLFFGGGGGAAGVKGHKHKPDKD